MVVGTLARSGSRCMASCSLSRCKYLLGLPATLVLMITVFVGNCMVKPIKITSVSADIIRVFFGWQYAA